MNGGDDLDEAAVEREMRSLGYEPVPGEIKPSSRKWRKADGTGRPEVWVPRACPAGYFDRIQRRIRQLEDVAGRSP